MQSHIKCTASSDPCFLNFNAVRSGKADTLRSTFVSSLHASAAGVLSKQLLRLTPAGSTVRCTRPTHSREVTPIIRILLASLLFVGVAVAEDKKEAKKLDGTWMFEKVVIDGNDATEVFGKATMKIDGTKFTLTIIEKEDAGTLNFDDAKSPKELDVITSKDSPNKGKTLQCVYKWDGDRVIICYGLDGKTRPTEFKAESKSQQMLDTYKLKK